MGKLIVSEFIAVDGVVEDPGGAEGSDFGGFDEYRLLVHPIVLGGGKCLFPEGGPEITPKLTDAKALDSGTVIQVYEPVRD